MTAKTLGDLKYADIFDSRDVIERIAELAAIEDDPAALTYDEREELRILREFADEAEGYTEDWPGGATFIRESYWVRYAEEYADEIGAVPSEYSWPQSYIDWDAAARDLQMDYSAVELAGVTFYCR